MRKEYTTPALLRLSVRSAVLAASLQKTSESASHEYEVLSKGYSGGLWEESTEED